MKLSKFFAAGVVACALAVSAAGAQDNPLTFSISVDGAYYFKSANISSTSAGSHFAPITGPYSGIEGRVTGFMNYQLNTPLGEHFLLKDANLVFTGSFELTPVSLKPGAAVTFTPLPFIVFKAGAELGTGWDFANLFKGGMSLYNYENETYDSLTPFTSWLLKTYAQATFQFDTGAIFAGDWTHVVMQFTYQAYYQMLTGAKNGEVWMWQMGGNKVNGWQQYMCGILAYQMPLVLKRVGIMFESEGLYSRTAYNQDKYAGYDGDFKEISLSPLMQFQFDEHNLLAVLFGFKCRRAYSDYTDDHIQPRLHSLGSEWFFNRIAFSYSYSF